MERSRLRLQIVQTIASLIGMTAIVIAYVQFQESERREEQSVYRTISADWNEHLRLFIEQPALRPYFFDAKPVAAGDPNADAVFAVAAVRIDLMDSILAHMNARGWSDKATAGWREEFKDAFATSPALCAEMARTSAHFGLLSESANAGCRALKLSEGGRRKPNLQKGPAAGAP
jgi:hypothetical protein